MCAGRKIKNTIFESQSLMNEWDSEKNTLDPRSISPGSQRVVWWKCSKGHSYEMRVSLKAVRNYGCPGCSGHRVEAGFNDFASACPDLIQFWDFEKNDIRPDEVTRESHKKVWWTCLQEHSYEMTVHKKVSRNAGCPVCSGHKTVKGVNDFATLYPELAKEWHPEKNGDLKPTDVSKKNGKKVWWQCRYGHEWQASVHDRVDGTGCPFCAERRLTSFPEQAIYYYIKKLYCILNNPVIIDACGRSYTSILLDAKCVWSKYAYKEIFRKYTYPIETDAFLEEIVRYNKHSEKRIDGLVILNVIEGVSYLTKPVCDVCVFDAKCINLEETKRFDDMHDYIWEPSKLDVERLKSVLKSGQRFHMPGIISKVMNVLNEKK